MRETQEKILLHLAEAESFAEAFGATPLKITELPMKNDSISGRVSFHQPSVFKLSIEFFNKPNVICVLKLKSEQIIQNGIKLMNYDNSEEFSKVMSGPISILGYNNSHIRESRFYDNVDESLKAYLPKILGSFYDADDDIYAILMSECENELSLDEELLLKTLDAITDYHAYYYNRFDSIEKMALNYHTAEDYREQRNILLGMLQKLDADNELIFSKRHKALLWDFAMNIDEYCEALPLHKTLTHNDFTPRNIFYQKDGIIIYDWELACFQCPEHDLIELILFVMSALSDEQILTLIDVFKQILFKKCNISFTDEIYNQILTFNLLEYCVNRLSLYRVCNKGLQVDFIDRLTENAERLLTVMNAEECYEQRNRYFTAR